MQGEGSLPSDPKVKRKYATLIETALGIEDDEPAAALELYKQAEALAPNTLTEKIAQLRVKVKGGNSFSSSSSSSFSSSTTTTSTTSTTTTTIPRTTTPPIPIENTPPSLPPPISDDILASLPDFSRTEFHDFPPPPPLSASIDSTSSSPPTGDSSNEDLELFLDQLTDFMQVMTKEDVDEMVSRKDYQVVRYLMNTTHERPPSEEHAELALKTAQCFMATCELVPAVYPSMIDARVVTWVVRWCKYYVTPKIEAEEGDDTTGNDESIVYFLQLLAVLCGQQYTALSLQERELLDDQAFITLMIKFAIHEYEYDEDSDIAFEAAVVLFGISAQFHSPSEDPIVFALYGIPEAATLGRFLIHVTNRGVSPKWLQTAALSTSRKLFDFSQGRQSECYFYTNDVLVREVLNLDENQTVLRMEYLLLMRAIVTHHEYIRNGKYKHDNVAEVLSIVGFQGFDEPASQFAQALFESIVDNNS